MGSYSERMLNSVKFWNQNGEIEILDNPYPHDSWTGYAYFIDSDGVEIEAEIQGGFEGDCDGDIPVIEVVKNVEIVPPAAVRAASSQWPPDFTWRDNKAGNIKEA